MHEQTVPLSSHLNRLLYHDVYRCNERGLTIAFFCEKGIASF